MPTYEYQCAACGHQFEAFQSITADPLSQCPSCSRNEAKRLIGRGAGLIFKGSGFYCTDYKSTSYKQDESVDRHKKAAKDVKESTKTEATPAAPSSTPTTSAS